MSITVYGIPTCSTCKKALKWLKDHDISHTWINTRETQPTQSQLKKWVQDLGNKALRNTSGKSYRALGEEKHTWSDAQWVEAFAKDSMLLKRPLFVRNQTALMTGFRGSDAELRKKLSI